MAIVGMIALFVSYIFNLKKLTLTATLGYIISFFIGALLDTKGIESGNGMIHDLWIVWLISYIILIGIAINIDFAKKIKKQKSITNYIGLFIGTFIVGASVFTYATKPLTMNDIMQHKPRFLGAVLEIQDNSMLLESDANSNIVDSSDKVVVSLDMIMTDASVSKDDFEVGDIVNVYYDGSVTESDPTQVNNVYAIYKKEVSKDENGITVGEKTYSFEEISVLTALPGKDLKEFYNDEPNQFVMDFINRLKTPLEYDGGDGNYYTFDEIAEIMGGSKSDLYKFYISDTAKFLERFKSKLME